jgi:catechol-2,3-dioxygenase
MSATIKRLNHAVLYVRDLDRSVGFYREAFGFEEIGREGGRMAFLRARGTNHPTWGCSRWASAPSPPPGATGLYHLAWEVGRIEELAEMETRLANMGALGGRSDHGATKSLYAKDPDGNEFEVMWMVPREEWGEYENRGVVMPLNMEREVARFGGR